MRVIDENDKKSINIANKFLKKGKIIAIPTDTVYGLAVDASNDQAIENLYKIKERDQQKPIAIFLPDFECAKKIFFFNEITKKIAEKFLPGKLTIVMKVKNEAWGKISKKLNQNNNQMIGFRIVDRPFIKNLLTKFDGILAVTSANKSGKNVACNIDQIKENFNQNDIDLIVDGLNLDNLPSTVIKIENNKIILLREGFEYKKILNFYENNQ
jgi:L-threonylcarbamoyladenylate synthase